MSSKNESINKPILTHMVKIVSASSGLLNILVVKKIGEFLIKPHTCNIK